MRFDDFVRDIRHTVRSLRRTPGFAVAVVLTLALGVGGNTAIFSVVDQVLLRPLPYPEGERLVRIYERNLNARNSDARFSNGVSPANWLDWQARSKTLSSMGVWFNMSRTLTGEGEPEQLNGQFVSWEFLQTLGVPPLVGRTLTADDDRRNAPRVAVLSYSLWEKRFAANPDVIGRVIQLDDAPVTIVGVMPRGFRFIQQDIDFWSPFGLDRNLPWREVAGRFTDVVARIAPNASFASAEAEMRNIAAELTTHPMNKDYSVTLVPLREEFTGPVQRSLVVLYAAVGVLLAIACFNVANLLLARSAARRREIAVRTALGAGRLPIVRQLLVESVTLAAGGGLLGLALARWSLDALLAFAPPGLLSVSELTIDQRVLLYALGLSVLTGVIVGLMPAVSLVRRSFLAHIHESGYRVTQSTRLRQSLVVAQVAMTIVLLCAAGLLVRTVIALNSASGGIDRSNLLTMEVTLPATRYNTNERTTGFIRQALDAIRALPGVESVGAGNSLPIIGPPRGGTRFHRLGTPQEAVNRLPITTVRVVTPGYFRTLRIPIVRGREFTDSDPANGFVVNEAFARAYLEHVDPLATSISVRMQREDPYLPIVGVVGDVASGSVRGETTPTVYYSNRQMPGQGMSFLIRTPQPEALSRRAIEAVHAIDPNLAVTFVRTLETAMTESIARERLNALVSTTFGLSGLLLAALGLYGLLAFLVTERTKEIGIRISLGAPLARVTASVVGSGLRLVAIGAVVGIGASLVLGRWLESLLFGVKPYDATTYLIALALIAVVAAVASYAPARRATSIEPLAALRQE
jgi:putative ABC transport system permease protein